MISTRGLRRTFGKINDGPAARRPFSLLDPSNLTEFPTSYGQKKEIGLMNSFQDLSEKGVATMFDTGIVDMKMKNPCIMDRPNFLFCKNIFVFQT
jgi:hypothetical protein